MFKFVISAGHYKYTPGKRCLKSIDPNETREWVLNSRIAEKVERILSDYEGIEILRVDDRTGEKDVSLSARSTAANNYGGNLYLAIHHNAGIKGGSGGGIVAYVHTAPSAESLSWQKDLYNALIEKTGLKGNRSRPLAQSNLHEVREPDMPSVLLELGFMDSTKDTPIILTEDYANKCAEAIASVVVSRTKLTKKVTGMRYRVIVGDYKSEGEAEAVTERLKKDGYSATIVAVNAKEDPIIPTIDPEPIAPPAEDPLKVGDSVKVKQGAKNYVGNGLASFVYTRVHQIKEISGDRAVITYNGAVAAAMNIKDLYRV